MRGFLSDGTNTEKNPGLIIIQEVKAIEHKVEQKSCFVIYIGTEANGESKVRCPLAAIWLADQRLRVDTLFLQGLWRADVHDGAWFLLGRLPSSQPQVHSFQCQEIPGIISDATGAAETWVDEICKAAKEGNYAAFDRVKEGEEVVEAGWLEKRGGGKSLMGSKGFEKRWFELWGTKFRTEVPGAKLAGTFEASTLRYYTNERATDADGAPTLPVTCICVLLHSKS